MNLGVTFDKTGSFARMFMDSEWYNVQKQTLILTDEERMWEMLDEAWAEYNAEKLEAERAFNEAFCEHVQKLLRTRARRRNLKKEKRGGFDAVRYKRDYSFDFASKDIEESILARDMARDFCTQLAEMQFDEDVFDLEDEQFCMDPDDECEVLIRQNSSEKLQGSNFEKYHLGYARGYDAGYADGRNCGWKNGYEAGYEAALAEMRKVCNVKK